MMRCLGRNCTHSRHLQTQCKGSFPPAPGWLSSDCFSLQLPWLTCQPEITHGKGGGLACSQVDRFISYFQFTEHVPHHFISFGGNIKWCYSRSGTLRCKSFHHQVCKHETYQKMAMARWADSYLETWLAWKERWELFFIFTKIFSLCVWSEIPVGTSCTDFSSF